MVTTIPALEENGNTNGDCSGKCVNTITGNNKGNKNLGSGNNGKFTY